MNRINLLILAVLAFGYAHPCLADFRVVHAFLGGANDGKRSRGEPIVVGSTIYGVTENGGTNDQGTIYKVNTDGTGFSILHSFEFGASDIARPLDGLTLIGSTLYGAAPLAGPTGLGAIYRIDLDGTGYSLLHSFAGGAEGRRPQSKMAVDGTTLYGTTNSEGIGHAGTIFRIETDGTGFEVLHSFTPATAGTSTGSSVIFSGGTLFGKTTGGGTYGNGTIFKLNTDGSDYSVLHDFGSGVSDGDAPFGRLIASGAILYGTTTGGGTNDRGTVFKINSDGTGYTVLRSFTGIEDGSSIFAPLTQSATELFGTATIGGEFNRGTVFKINSDGTGFTVLHAFASEDGGKSPFAGLTLSGSMLFGATREGNGPGTGGILYSIEVPEPSGPALLISASTAVVLLWIAVRRQSIIAHYRDISVAASHVEQNAIA